MLKFSELTARAFMGAFRFLQIFLHYKALFTKEVTNFLYVHIVVQYGKYGSCTPDNFNYVQVCSSRETGGDLRRSGGYTKTRLESSESARRRFTKVNKKFLLLRFDYSTIISPQPIY